MIFTARFLIGRWSAKDLLQWESAIYHWIKLEFEGQVAKKFLNGIYYLALLLTITNQLLRRLTYFIIVVKNTDKDAVQAG